MAPQFQPPTFLTQQPTPLQALAAPLGSAISSIPELYDQYKTRRLQQQLELQKAKSQFGTGAPAPTFATAAPDQLQTGTPAQPTPGAGPEEQLFGDVGGMPTVKPETPEDTLSRIGTEAYGKLHPSAGMIVPFINKEGQQIGSGPANTKIVDKPNTFLFDPVKRQLLDPTGKPVDTAPPGADIKIIPQSPNINLNFKNEDELRKEFLSNTKDQKANLSAASDALSAANQGNAAGDTKLTYALTRGALGGNGRVTQTEIGQWGQNLGNLPDKIQQGILKLATGQTFDPAVRKQIVDMVKQQALEESNKLSQAESQYRQLAIDNKLQPGHVAIEQRPASLLPYLRPQQNQTSQQDAAHQAALDWANKNPNDPRAKRIKQINGI